MIPNPLEQACMCHYYNTRLVLVGVLLVANPTELLMVGVQFCIRV
jgi:hypothetical protein